jgi:hypothetical protein
MILLWIDSSELRPSNQYMFVHSAYAVEYIPDKGQEGD